MTANHAFDAEQASLHVLGLLAPTEAVAFDTHLAGCPACRARYAEFVVVHDALALGAPAAEPSPAMDDAFRARLAAEPPRTAPAPSPQPATPAGARGVPARRPGLRLPAWAAAAIVVLAVSTAALGVQSLRLGRQLAVASHPTVHVAELAATGSAPRGVGRIVMIDTPQMHEVHMFVAGLGPLSGSQVYQLWAIRDGRPIDAGTFRVGSDGTASMSAPMPPGMMQGAETMAVTLEPDANGKQPRGTVLLAGRIG